MAIDREIQRELDKMREEHAKLKEEHAQLASQLGHIVNPDDPHTYLSTDLHNLGQVPTAGVYNSGVQAVTSGIGGTTLTWDTVSWDTDQIWDSTNNWFAPRVSGIYLCTLSVQIADADLTDKRGIELLSNGTLSLFYSVEYLADQVNDTNLAVAGLFIMHPQGNEGASTHVLARVIQNSGSTLDVSGKAFNIVKVADFGQIGNTT